MGSSKLYEYTLVLPLCTAVAGSIQCHHLDNIMIDDTIVIANAERDVFHSEESNAAEVSSIQVHQLMMIC